jgi:hypothetical protein
MTGQRRHWTPFRNETGPQLSLAPFKILIGKQIIRDQSKRLKRKERALL